MLENHERKKYFFYLSKLWVRCKRSLEMALHKYVFPYLDTCSVLWNDTVPSPWMLNSPQFAFHPLKDYFETDENKCTSDFHHITSTISWEAQSVRGAWNILTKWTNQHRRWQDITFILFMIFLRFVAKTVWTSKIKCVFGQKQLTTALQAMHFFGKTVWRSLL